MRLFYLNVRSGKIEIADLEKFTMLNIGRYVFLQAKQEQYEANEADVAEVFVRVNSG